MCLVETISEHLAKLCHLSVSQGQSTNHRETSKERYLKSTTNLVEPNPDSKIAHCQAHQLPRTPPPPTTLTSQKNLVGRISGLKRATGDPLVSKRLDF